jgi:hypothetical protein
VPGATIRKKKRIRAMRRSDRTPAAMLENLLVLRIQGARRTNIVFAGRARESTITAPPRAVHFFFLAAKQALRACTKRRVATRDARPASRHSQRAGRYRMPSIGRAGAARVERGQGTVEYVALIALVALIMVGVIAAMKSTQFAEGQQLGSLILKKIAEAVTKVHY